MTDNIIKFQKPVDLHKELAFRMNVVSTAEKFYIKLSERQPIDLKYDPDMCIAWAEAFHNKAQLYIDDIMNKIEKEAK